MSRPGSVSQLPDHDGWSCLLPVAEALVDHEVTFAVLPDLQDLSDAILRLTGSRVAAVEEADYVFCRAETLADALTRAKDGTPEYPDASATVICEVEAFEESGQTLSLSGPGIRDTTRVAVAGLSVQASTAYQERNAAPPIGVDVVLVSGSGQVVCLSRYTNLQLEG
jgi:phosphonate C-P lyase system protein PhnH